MSFKIRVSYSECISPSFSIFVIRSFFPLWAISIQGPSLVSKVALYVSPICSSIIKSISNGAEKKTLYFSSQCYPSLHCCYSRYIPARHSFELEHQLESRLSVVLSSTFLVVSICNELLKHILDTSSNHHHLVPDPNRAMLYMRNFQVIQQSPEVVDMPTSKRNYRYSTNICVPMSWLPNTSAG